MEGDSGAAKERRLRRADAAALHMSDATKHDDQHVAGSPRGPRLNASVLSKRACCKCTWNAMTAHHLRQRQHLHIRVRFLYVQTSRMVTE